MAFLSRRLLVVALVSKHYEIMVAIHAAIVSDAELTAVIPAAQWLKQKRAWHRRYKWSAGGFVVPIRTAIPAHENRQRRYDFRCLVATLYPSNQDLTLDLEKRLAVQERIDSIFAWTPKEFLPASIRALGSAHAGTGNAYSLDSTGAEPGDLFLESAFDDNLDAFGTVVTVTVTGPKQDYSALGV